jgi:cytidylate kinase
VSGFAKAPVVIAVDGPTASGKGTLARRLAAHYRYAYLDTGALYRAVAYRVLEAGADPTDHASALGAAIGLDPAAIPDAALRSDRVGGAASQVAAIPALREALLAFQRRFATDPPGGAPGAVLDGRDIGTVICPDAAVKLYVTADVEVRARRRALELRGRGLPAEEAQVLADLKARDHRDMTRAAAPLKPAEDAHLLDTTGLDIEAAFAAARAIIDKKLG